MASHGFPTPGLQQPTPNQIMENLFFLSDIKWEEARQKHKYDVIIIGTGFCALAVARRALTNNPQCRILIIERGTLFLPEHFQNLPKPFDRTLGGMTETFPWTLSLKTASGEGGTVRWQHGMIPFFGGRSVMWSAWCPEPTDKELYGWPDDTKRVIQKNLKDAAELLDVQKVDEVEADLFHSEKPIYGPLQSCINKLLQDKGLQVEGVYRIEAAPIACDGIESNIDFEKYSVPGELLSLVKITKASATVADLDIFTNCIVEKICQQDGEATALQTSRGFLPIGKAKLVLAMGTLPPTTLVRNSFPHMHRAGERFSAHFITSIVARVPRDDFDGDTFGELELGAFYIAGTRNNDYRQQYHIQLSAISNKHPVKYAETALRYMPDVVATASKQQLLTSEDYVIFVCAVLGELDVENEETWFRHNKDDTNLTTNSLLQVTLNNTDTETWDAMDKATFEILEEVLSPNGPTKVEYWHGAPDDGKWKSERPSEKQRRVDALVHESSTLHIGDVDDALVDTNYLLRDTTNVYITGGALWPRGGSFNPTLTMVALAQDLADKLVPKGAPLEK